MVAIQGDPSGFGPVDPRVLSSVQLDDLYAALAAVSADEPAYDPTLVLRYVPLGPSASTAEAIDLYSVNDGLLTCDFSVSYCRWANEADVAHHVTSIVEAIGARIDRIITMVDSDLLDPPPIRVDVTLVLPDVNPVTMGDVAAAINAARTVLTTGDWKASPLTLLAQLQSVGCQVLLGLDESEVVDFKRPAYAVATEPAAHEFALDVAAFANADAGGIIILGVATHKLADNRDRVDDIVGCAVDHRLSDSYYQKVDALIVPKIRGFSVVGLEHQGRQLVALVIPPQSDRLRPFIIPAATDGRKVSKVTFTMPTRRGDGKRYPDVHDVHAMLCAGRRQMLT
jgi:hypothetical protein